MKEKSAGLFTKFAVLGGDSRCVELCNQLNLAGKKVYAFGFEKSISFDPGVTVCGDLHSYLEDCEIVIFPLPVTKDKVNLFAPYSVTTYPLVQIFTLIQNAKAVFGGKVSYAVLENAREFGIEIHDYLNREEFAVLNAVPTAEGAVQIAMQEMPRILSDCHCLITGYGRISKVLVSMLRGLGCEITVSARKKDQLAWAQIYGCHTVALSQLKNCIGKFDVVFNTVPAIILNKELIGQVQPKAVLIDLASIPGGIDFSEAAKRNLKAINAQSLPGKFAPVTAGKIIMDTVLNMCEEFGVAKDDK